MHHIILIHGALGAATQLAPLEPLLAADDSTHVLELEGHGDTPGDGPYSIDRFAQTVRTLMDARRLEHAAIFGYSLGGYVALRAAALYPERITSVATLGTKLAWTPAVAARETSRLDPATIRAKVPKFADTLETRHAACGGWETVLQKTATIMTELGENPPLDSAALSALAQPVRLMVGDRDNVVTLDETAAASKLMARGSLAVLPDTHHPFEHLRLSLLAALLQDFFTESAAIPDSRP